MDIKAIVLDIDGTLLTSEKVISEKTKVALINAQKNGIKVILASGRPTNSMYSLAEDLEMDKYEGFLVSYNGAMLTDCKTKDILFNQAIERDLAKAILKHLKQFDVIPMINDDTHMYVNDVFNNEIHLEGQAINIIQYESRAGGFLLCEKKDLASTTNFPINKILVAGEPDYLLKHHKAIRKPFEGQVTTAFSAPFYFEFTDQGINKAKTLNTLFSEMDIASHNMMAFGDSQNDITLVEYAGIGVAMGNAVDELKAIADEVSLSNDEDGIVSTLEKYL